MKKSQKISCKWFIHHIFADNCEAIRFEDNFLNCLEVFCVFFLIFFQKMQNNFRLCLICIVACAYLEGDRAVTCGVKQQFGQVRRALDLNITDFRRTHGRGFSSACANFFFLLYEIASCSKLCFQQIIVGIIAVTLRKMKFLIVLSLIFHNSRISLVYHITDCKGHYEI